MMVEREGHPSLVYYNICKYVPDEENVLQSLATYGPICAGDLHPPGSGLHKFADG